MRNYYVSTLYIKVYGVVYEVEGVHSGSVKKPWPSRVLQL